MHKDALRHAADSFQQAVDIDPVYAKAYAGLASAWSSLRDNSFAGYDDRHTGLAISRALEIAPNLVDGWVRQTFKLLSMDVNIRGALAAISTALEISPGSAEVQVEYARLKCYVGDRSESITAARKALDLDPHYPKPHYFISMALYHQGNIESAWEEIQREPLNWMNWTGSALVLQRLGRIEEAGAFLKKLSLDEDEDPAYIQQAAVYAQRGDIDQAMQCLSLAFGHKDPGLSQLLVDPLMDPLREDLRFVELMKKLGFEPKNSR